MNSALHRSTLIKRKDKIKGCLVPTCLQPTYLFRPGTDHIDPASLRGLVRTRSGACVGERKKTAYYCVGQHQRYVWPGHGRHRYELDTRGRHWAHRSFARWGRGTIRFWCHCRGYQLSVEKEVTIDRVHHLWRVFFYYGRRCKEIQRPQYDPALPGFCVLVREENQFSL